MHPTYVAIALSALAAASTGTRRPDAGPANPDRVKLETFLATHDVSSAGEIRAIASAPDRALIAIATDAHADRLTRARAMAALRLLPSPAVQAFLEKFIEENAKDTDATLRLLLRRAAVGLGWMPGSDTPEQLSLLFENEDADVRLDAVLGIGMTRSATAADVLRKQLAVETAPRVRDQIRRQIDVLGEPEVKPEKPPAAKKPAREPTHEPMRGGF